MFVVFAFSYALAVSIVLALVFSKYSSGFSLAFFFISGFLVYAWALADPLTGSYAARFFSAVAGATLGVIGGILVARELIGILE